MTLADRVIAYVGLGANIGEPGRNLQAALDELGNLPHTRLTSSSGFYRSAPLGNTEQPDFLNAVAELRTGMSSETLLDGLLEIELRHGRKRTFKNAPRTLDLDLLLYGQESIVSDRLTVPHPRMHERAFVLKPLAEISPDILIPGKGKVRDLLAGCAGQIAEKVDG